MEPVGALKCGQLPEINNFGHTGSVLAFKWHSITPWGDFHLQIN